MMVQSVIFEHFACNLQVVMYSQQAVKQSPLKPVPDYMFEARQ